MTEQENALGRGVYGDYITPKTTRQKAPLHYSKERDTVTLGTALQEMEVTMSQEGEADLNAIRDACSKLDGTEEDTIFGEPHFLLGGRKFAFLHNKRGLVVDVTAKIANKIAGRTVAKPFVPVPGSDTWKGWSIVTEPSEEGAWPALIEKAYRKTKAFLESPPPSETNR